MQTNPHVAVVERAVSLAWGARLFSLGWALGSDSLGWAEVGLPLLRHRVLKDNMTIYSIGISIAYGT